MVGTCSPVDRMDIKAMPVIATLAMAENHIKANSIRLQLQNVGMSRRNYHKHDSAPISLYRTQLCRGTYHISRGQKKPGKQRSDGVAVLRQACACTREGGH